MKTLLRALACGALIGTAACGSDGPAAPEAPIYPFDGNWIGATSDGSRVRMKIEQSRITIFDVTVRVTPTCTTALSAPASATTITDHTFSLSGRIAGGLIATVAVTGRIDGSNRSLNGTIGAINATGAICGQAAFTRAEQTFTANQ